MLLREGCRDLVYAGAPRFGERRWWSAARALEGGTSGYFSLVGEGDRMKPDMTIHAVAFWSVALFDFDLDLI
jgi:hypothetical protein